MTINVYWACAEDQWLMAKAPESVASLFYEKQYYEKTNPDMQMNGCPAFRNHLDNVFTMRSIYDYEFYIKDSKLHSNYYNQEFFNKHVLMRSAEKKCFSFLQSYAFFTDSPSLEATIGELPFMEDNNITKRCIPIAGKYDIGKWFRTTEFAFFLKNDFDSFKIERDEIFSYIRFHTDEKINFIQFRWTDKLEEYKNDCFYINFFKYIKTLENYYRNFRHKKLILKEIKNNIL
jgi:hypothetical protein